MDSFDRYFFRSAYMLFAVLMIVVLAFALVITVASKNAGYGLNVLLIAGSVSAALAFAATAWGRQRGVLPMGDDEIEESMHKGFKAMRRFAPFIAAGFVPSLVGITATAGGNAVFYSTMAYGLILGLTVIFILPFIAKAYFITE